MQATANSMGKELDQEMGAEKAERLLNWQFPGFFKIIMAQYERHCSPTDPPLSFVV